MSLVDEITITAKAGNGGSGVVRWRHEKYIPKGGPAGGDGGRGGNFCVQATKDIYILSQYKSKKNFCAGNGEDGGNKSLHGKNGADFILKLPIGSVIKNLDTGQIWQLLNDKQEILILKGGNGGWGNEHFKSSINISPKKFTPGKEGECGNFKIELRLFADLGLIGFPNAGKSSLLNALTNSSAKIGDYPFTTLNPNLGNFYNYIIADLPGIIENAHKGKGLGIKFLRHIKRTKILAHLISFEHLFKGLNGMTKAYKLIRKELEYYDKEFSKEQDTDDDLLKLFSEKEDIEEDLADKKEIIILTKSDLVEDKKLIDKAVKQFEKIGKKVISISLFDDKSIINLRNYLVKILKNS